MKIPEYISRDEVKRSCQELGISDWTQLKEAKVSTEEAEKLQRSVGAEALMVSVEDFQGGLEVELEHGITFSDANVTNNHPILTAMIVLAHLKETLDYYTRLEVAELEGDLLKAVKDGKADKAMLKYKLLVEAQAALYGMIKDEFGNK